MQSDTVEKTQQNADRNDQKCSSGLSSLEFQLAYDNRYHEVVLNIKLAYSKLL